MRIMNQNRASFLGSSFFIVPLLLLFFCSSPKVGLLIKEVMLVLRLMLPLVLLSTLDSSSCSFLYRSIKILQACSHSALCPCLSSALIHTLARDDISRCYLPTHFVAQRVAGRYGSADDTYLLEQTTAAGLLSTMRIIYRRDTKD